MFRNATAVDMRPVSLYRVLVSLPAARRSATAGFALRVIGMALLFSQTWVLARLLGSVKFGDYAWALAWGTVLRLVVSLGFDQLVVRELVVYRARADWASVRGLLRRCDLAVFAVSVVLLPVAGLAGSALAKTGSGQRGALFPALLWLPLVGWLTIRSAAVQAMGRFGLSRVSEDVVFPGLFLGFLIFAAASGVSLSATSAMTARVLCMAGALIVGNIILRTSFPPEAHGVLPQYPTRAWMATTVPLLLIGAAGVVQSESGTILVGAIRGSAESGPYAIALRIAFLLTLSEFTVQGVLGPRIAHLHEHGDQRGLQQTLTRSARTVTGLASILGILYLAVPGLFLGLFGHGFADASSELRVLTLGWLVNLSFGSSGLLLIMIGEERKAAAGLIVGALINLPLAVVLVLHFGGLGAAISTSTSMLIWNLILWWQAWKLGYDTSLVGFTRPLPSER